MLDPICNREIDYSMLKSDYVHVRHLIHKLMWMKWAGCIPALQDRNASILASMKQLAEAKRVKEGANHGGSTN